MKVLQRFQEAFEELRKTTELDPEHLDSRVKLGNYYIAAARNNPQFIAEAERLAKAILQKDPNHVEGHILMGSVLYAQNQREQAFAEINQAIELDPKRVESYLSLARFYIVTNDKAKAEETFRRAISVNDNSGLAHTEYGKYLVQQNRLGEAEAEMIKAVAVEPTNRSQDLCSPVSISSTSKSIRLKLLTKRSPTSTKINLKARQCWLTSIPQSIVLMKRSASIKTFWERRRISRRAVTAWAKSC